MQKLKLEESHFRVWGASIRSYLESLFKYVELWLSKEKLQLNILGSEGRQCQTLTFCSILLQIPYILSGHGKSNPDLIDRKETPQPPPPLHLQLPLKVFGYR